MSRIIKKWGVIFDMDGVLVNSNEAHFEAFKQLGHHLGVPFTRQTLEKTFGMHNSQIFPLWLGSDLSTERAAQLALEKESIYRNLVPQFVKPIEGVIDLIESLSKQGALLAVGSSGPRLNVNLALDILGVGPLFQAVCTGDDIKRGKPDPEIFLKAAAKLELSPSSCIVIEDAPSGVQAARAAGTKIVALTTSVGPEQLEHADLIVNLPTALNAEMLWQLLKH